MNVRRLAYYLIYCNKNPHSPERTGIEEPRSEIPRASAQGFKDLSSNLRGEPPGAERPSRDQPAVVPVPTVAVPIEGTDAEVVARRVAVNPTPKLK